jgi:hypothetical protein
MKANRNKQIHFRLSEPLYTLIEEVAIDEETSVAAISRRILRNHFETIAADRFEQRAGTDGDSELAAAAVAA